MIGYKKAYDPTTEKFVLIELEIAEGVKFIEGVNWFSFGCKPKCRAEKVKVLKIHGGCKKARSLYESTFTYEEGKEVYPLNVVPWKDTISSICGDGIHFFKDKQSALEYDNGGYMPTVGQKLWNRDIKDQPKKITAILIEDALCDDEVKNAV
jgi:hypothetical protein